MKTSAGHVLLVSEDQGNGAALARAQTSLASGAAVTWICSTPTSQALTELEAASALKNTYMGALNLLVITRNESQPFGVLTGELDRERIRQCAELLMDTASVSQVLVGGASARQLELKDWITEQIPAVNIELLTAGPEAQHNASPATDHQASEPPPGTDTVAVSVIMQGRELSFSMPRTAGTLLDGAEDAGLDLPFSCRGGVCSTCRAKLTAGAVELVENYALEDWELEAGFTLPCQAEPVTDKITLDYDEV